MASAPTASHGTGSLGLPPARYPARGRNGTSDAQLLGRQSIFAVSGRRFACELLFRSPRPRPTTPDAWSARDQDAATKDVVETALRCGLSHLGGTAPVFVNATRSLVLGELVPPLPRQMGIELVESLVADDHLMRGVRRLRSRGHLIAVDDFTATEDQLRLLPLADVVKIDLRDLARHGPALLERAREHGAQTVVERVETLDALHRCIDLGFDHVQGNVLEPALVLEVGRGWSHPRDADATRSTARSTAKTGSLPSPFTSASA